MEHTENFETVTWRGGTDHVSPKQRLAVEALYDAHCRMVPGISQEPLVERGRLRDLFRTKDATGKSVMHEC